MKPDTHPDYRPVIFHDTSVDIYFKIGSTVDTDRTIVWEEDGQEYPYVTLDVSSASHPYYTGKQRKTSNEGRGAKFQKRFGSRYKAGQKS